MGSSRLPGKVMMLVDNSNSIIWYVINQIKHSKLCEKMIIATTTLVEDDVIVNFAKENSVQYFRGNSEDCLDRYYRCAELFSISTIVRITCDNPLIDPTLIDNAIVEFNAGDFDYVSNCKPRSFPQGTEVEVFSFKALEKAWSDAQKMSEREHVTPYFYNNPDKFKICNITNQENISNLRWTVDREQDLKFIRAVVTRIKKSPILMKDILEILKKEPELIDINKNYVMDEGYKKSLQSDEVAS